MADRKKPWPFVGKSLFLYDPGHDTEDRAVYDHVLGMLRADFGLSPDDSSPRLQILLDDVVDSYSRLSVYRSKIDPAVLDQDERHHKERRLRDEIRKALNALMAYTNAKKVHKTVSIEGLLSKMTADE